MPRYYILNSAVVTSPGTYKYCLISLNDAKAWLDSRSWYSTIGYEQTATALEELTGIHIPVNREIITMQPGDEALVFRLSFPKGTKRIDPKQKGQLPRDFILSNCEIGLLRKISND